MATPVAKASTIVLSNGPAPGDSFTNATGANQGQAVGASGWVYNNVRNGGSVGISTALPRSGTGSAAFASPSGSAKADIEYLAAPVAIGGNYVASNSLGRFADLVSFGYDWYRDGASTVNGTLHPALRVLLDADGNLATINDRGGLVFERVYNGLPTPTDTWTTDTVGAGTNLWNFGLGLGFAANINATDYAYDATLAEWQAYLPDAVVLGFSAGVGSGWNGSFTGAVDNITWTIGTASASANFEVPAPVPAPAALGLFGFGLLGLAAIRRRPPRA